MVTNVFYPQIAYINAITNAQKAVISFTDDHDFTIGEIVGFRVRPPFGMFQINNINGKVLSLTSTSITVDVDTTTWDAFDYSQLNTAGSTPPTCVPCCSGKIPNSNPVTINQADTFDNRRV